MQVHVLTVAQVADAVREARAVYGSGWHVRVLVDSSVGSAGRQLLSAAGAAIVDADSWLPASVGNLRWAFWPFLFAEKGGGVSGSDEAIERFVVRAAGYRCGKRALQKPPALRKSPIQARRALKRALKRKKS